MCFDVYLRHRKGWIVAQLRLSFPFLLMADVAGCEKSSSFASSEKTGLYFYLYLFQGCQGWFFIGQRARQLNKYPGKGAQNVFHAKAQRRAECISREGAKARRMYFTQRRKGAQDVFHAKARRMYFTQRRKDAKNVFHAKARRRAGCISREGAKTQRMYFTRRREECISREGAKRMYFTRRRAGAQDVFHAKAQRREGAKNVFHAKG